MSSNREQIIQKAKETLVDRPEGIRYSEFVRLIHEALPSIPINTVHGTVWNLEVKLPSEFYKPARGIYKLVKFRTDDEHVVRSIEKVIREEVITLKEEAFYAPFADWLVNELEECTRAVPLGSNRFKDKWGTPDVIGIREPKRSAIIKPPTEIISVEIKIDTAGLITAFGQACSYKLFSHKSYIVVPKTSSEDDIGRLDTLSRIFGIGLILFNNSSTENAGFEIRSRANKDEPDMFYMNKYLSLIEDSLFK